MSIKEKLLSLWEKIIIKYANNQVNKLRTDFKDIAIHNSYYKKLYNILLLLLILNKKPMIKIIDSTEDCVLLELYINDQVIQLPLTEYKGVLNTIDNKIEQNKTYKFDQPETSIDRLYKYMLEQILENQDD